MASLTSQFQNQAEPSQLDNFIIPSTAQNKDKVEQLINYYYDPVVAAKVAAYVNYITPVKGAQEAMADVDPSLVDNELIFPSAATQSKLQVFRALTPAEVDRVH